MKKKVILVLTILLTILFSTIVVAENLNDLQNKKNELQNQITESNEQIEDIKIELTENLEQLNSLNQKIETYETEISSLEENLSKISLEIDDITVKLNSIEESYNLQREALQNRLVALYEAGDIYYLDVLLKSNTISEFISNYYMIGEIARYDNELLENIGKQKNEIETIKTTLTERKNSLESIKKNKEKTTISLENSKIIRNSYINKLTDDEKAMQEKIDKYQAELNSLDAQITTLTSLNIGEDYIGGEFMWPAPGYSTVTSKFGMRYHPVLKITNLHKGNDIAMPTGSYIVASNDGVVTQAFYTTGYGNMIMIDHGGGITTLYAHGSEIISQVGDTVKKGDLIMKAGSTGWSTGPHLHFEVRINGTPIDSIEFLNNQSKYLGNEENNEPDENNQINQENNQVNGGEN